MQRCGFFAEVRGRRDVPPFQAGSDHAIDRDGGERIEAIHECHTDVDFSGLTVGVT